MEAFIDPQLHTQAHVIGQQIIEVNPIITQGLILDIGGGGEGIIGKLNGEQVIAIDKLQSELEETDNNALKIVMDVTNLKFLNETFTVATAFFSMMYIPNDLISKVLAETYRVLRKGGNFYIWDANITEKYSDKKYFIIPLKVIMPDETVETGYGVQFKQQDIWSLKQQAMEAGFIVKNEEIQEYTFYLKLEK